MKRRYWLVHYSYRWQLVLFLLGLVMLFAQAHLEPHLPSHAAFIHAYMVAWILCLLQFGLMKRCDLETWRRAHGTEQRDVEQGPADPPPR